MVHTILTSSLVGLALLVLKSLVSEGTRLIKVGLSVISPAEAVIAVSVVVAGPVTVCCPVLWLIVEGFLWSIVVTVIVAATVLVVVKVPSASGETIPPIVSIPATSTAP